MSKKKASSKRERFRNIYALMLKTGYIESASNHMFVAFNPKGFKSVNDALADLAEMFQRAILAEWQYIKRICCEKAPEGSSYCPTCGRRIWEGLMQVDEETFTSKVLNFVGGVIDGTHDTWQELHDGGWEIGWNALKRIGKKSVVAIGENSEKYMYHAMTGDFSKNKPEGICYNPYRPSSKMWCEIHGRKVRLY